ncbi:Uncharacterized protein AB751O23_AF_00180 [Chlamydiales bacterium SCGC AB-751-O23]|nr:Uncharacterized protein AB751O23_AF_00180 [Chlamydiales bacterium SCGC AB-751-O23]
MTGYFQDTAYLRAIKQITPQFSNREICKFAKQNLFFKYTNVNHQAFNAQYSPDGWMGRKFIAIPATLFSGLVKTTYHLAKAIFIGIPKAIFPRSRYFTAQIFHIGRDFQEAFGRFSSLFNDRFGQFHIQESQFHKSCYDLTPTQHNGLDAHTEYGVWITNFAEKTSLFDYKAKTLEERCDLETLSSLETTTIQISDTQSLILDDILEQLGDDTLKNLYLKDLVIPFEYSSLKYALLSEEEFSALKLADLTLNRKQTSFIRERFSLLKTKNPEKVEDLDYENPSLECLSRLTGSEINKNRNEMPPLAFSFLRNDQLTDIKLSDLDAPKCQALFNGLNKEQMKKRFSLYFDTKDTLNAIRMGYFKGINVSVFFDLIPDEQLKDLPISKLSYSILNDMFYTHKPKKSDKARFALFNPTEVQLALKSGFLDGKYHMSLISDEQLKTLKLSKLSYSILNDMFYTHKPKKSDKARFALFNPTEVQLAIESGFLDGKYHMSLISDEQLKTLQLSKLSYFILNNMFYTHAPKNSDKTRFALFNPTEVQLALESGFLVGKYHMSLISDEQLKTLKLSKLSYFFLNDMFYTHRPKDSEKTRFALFNPDEVQLALEKGILEGEYHRSLISNEQIQGFDFSKLSQNTIMQLFPSLDIDKLRESTSSNASYFREENGVVINNRQGWVSFMNEEQLSNKIEERKINTRRICALLTSKQREDLEALFQPSRVEEE